MAATSKVWFITGCSSGFGTMLARTVLARGDRLIASSRNPSRTPELVEEVTKKGGHWIAMDVTASDVKDVVKKAEEIYGRLDVVVNNAGYSVLGVVEETPMSMYQHQLETNLYGPVKVIQAVLPGMRARSSGTIVNMSSTSGLRSGPTAGIYAASKFALEGLSEGLAAEVAPFGVRVLVVEPSAFRTGFLTDKGKEQHAGGGVQYAPISDTYMKTDGVANMFKLFKDLDGKQAGDPEKAAERIYDVVTGEGMAKDKNLGSLLRLPLGSGAVAAGRGKIASLTEVFDKMEDIAKSADF